MIFQGKHDIDLTSMGFTQRAWIEVKGNWLEFWFEPVGRIAKQDLHGFLKQREPKKAIKLAWYFIMKKYKRRYGNEIVRENRHIPKP